MRVLLISTFFPPQHAVASQRAWSFASTWAAAGERVTVLTTPTRPDQQGDEPAVTESFDIAAVPYSVPRMLEWLRRFEKIESPGDSDGTESSPGEANKKVIRTLARRWRQRTGAFSAVRMPDLTDYWVKPATAWAVSHGPWDVVYSSAGPYTTHLVARRLRQSGHAGAWIAEFRDLWTENHTFRGLFPFTVRERMFERDVLQSADALVTISEPLASRLAPHAAVPVEVIYNGYEPIKEAQLPAERRFCRGSSDKQMMNLVFTGTHYPPMQNPDPLLAAMRQLQEEHPDIAARLRIHVAGLSADGWRQAAAQLGVSELVEVHGFVDKTTARWMQRDADALVFLDWNGPEKGILTSKLFEYLASPAPILIVGGQENSCVDQFIRDVGGGVRLGADVPHIARTLRAFVLDPTGIDASRDQSVVRTYSRDHQSRRALDLLRSVSRTCADS